jgi:hypothetical protein
MVLRKRTTSSIRSAGNGIWYGRHLIHSALNSSPCWAKGWVPVGSKRDPLQPIKMPILRSQAAHHWERAGAYGRALAYAYLRNGQRDSARTVFARLTEWYAAPSTRDTTWWAGTLLASITSDPDSLLSRLGQVSRLLPGIHNPQVISFYYGVRGRHLAESGRTTAGATCFQQAVLAIDTITEKTIPQAEAHAIDPPQYGLCIPESR